MNLKQLTILIRKKKLYIMTKLLSTIGAILLDGDFHHLGERETPVTTFSTNMENMLNGEENQGYYC